MSTVHARATWAALVRLGSVSKMYPGVLGIRLIWRQKFRDFERNIFRYSSLDSQRLVISHFALGGLSLLDAIDELDHRDDIIDWIYSLQLPSGGFVGSDVQRNLSGTVSQAHIASTFSAVHCLIILGDDLSRINVKMLLSWVGSNQNFEGRVREMSYWPVREILWFLNR